MKNQLQQATIKNTQTVRWKTGSFVLGCAIYLDQGIRQHQGCCDSSASGSCICIIKNVPALASSQYSAKCQSYSWGFVFQGWLYLLDFFFFCFFLPGAGAQWVLFNFQREEMEGVIVSSILDFDEQEGREFDSLLLCCTEAWC